MTDYAKLKLDFEKLSGAIGTLKRLQSQLDTMDTTPFPDDARNLRALFHSPDKASEAQALMRQLEEKLAAHERAEREREEEDRKKNAERERQAKILKIRRILSDAETALNRVINSPRDNDMDVAAMEALKNIRWMVAAISLPYTDPDTLQAGAEQLGEVASQLAQEQHRRDGKKRRSTGGSDERRSSGGSSNNHGEERAESGDPKGFYALFRVSPDAPAEEIKRAYRAMIQQYHPDLFEHEDHEWVRQEAAEMAKKLNEAWDVLGDPAGRRDYDRS